MSDKPITLSMEFNVLNEFNTFCSKLVMDGYTLNSFTHEHVVAPLRHGCYETYDIYTGVFILKNLLSPTLRLMSKKRANIMTFRRLEDDRKLITLFDSVRDRAKRFNMEAVITKDNVVLNSRRSKKYFENLELTNAYLQGYVDASESGV